MIKSQKDFFAGLLFLLLGIAFAIGAYNYRMGTGVAIGPGYFPRILGILLAVLGGVIVFKSLTVPTADGEKIGRWAWKPVLCIVGANIAFGILLVGLPSIQLPAMGLIVAIYALTFIASLAREHFDVKEVLLLATVLAVFSYGAFIYLLKLRMPVWPAFMA
jgi:hypothetical protein